eukprot:scaffold270842_cov28-Tisochrysis_lutea.AAC.3
MWATYFLNQTTNGIMPQNFEASITKALRDPIQKSSNIACSFGLMGVFLPMESGYFLRTGY